MAKELTPSQVAAALAEMGLNVPKELKAKVANESADAAERHILEVSKRESDKDGIEFAEAWRAKFFGLALEMNDFPGEEKNVGQGRVFERSIELTTDAGAKIMVRVREPREKK